MTNDQKKQFLQNSDQFNANDFKNRLTFVINGFKFPAILNDSACYLFDSNIRYINSFLSLVGECVLLKFGSIIEVQNYGRKAFHRNTEYGTVLSKLVSEIYSNTTRILLFFLKECAVMLQIALLTPYFSTL